MYAPQDTIAAIATPLGRGGIGIIRLSGKRAFTLAAEVFRSKEALGREKALLFGKVQDPDSKEVLDEGLLLAMPGPRSYTGEDVVELHLHGSPSLLSLLMAILVRRGARMADPGEFTYRAFQAGRLDLAQAEAVEALISAQGEAARRQALNQLTGGLSSYLEPLEEALKALYLKVEARLEFSEDGLPPLDLPAFRKEVEEVELSLDGLLKSYDQGRVVREGLKVALVGPPNTGKSSLLNALLGSDRAIVTPQAGTTRDVVEGDVLLKGVRVRFFDTAGLRETGDLVEKEGVKRSRKIMEEADLLFWLVDSSEPGNSTKELQGAGLPMERTWVIFNKNDLAQGKELSFSGTRNFALSCRTGEGLGDLQGALETFLGETSAPQEAALTSLRHKAEVEGALGHLKALTGLLAEGQPFELLAEELKGAALAVGRIRGRNLPAAAFEEIFTKFCIGK